MDALNPAPCASDGFGERPMRRRRPGWLRSYLVSLPALMGGIRNRGAALRLALGGGRCGRRIELRCGLVLRVRSLLELWVVRATVLDCEYLPPEIELGETATVLDAGASIGDFSLFVARKHPLRTVHAFEPEPAAFALLESNRRANRIDNVTAHPLALADRDGVAELAIDRRRPVLNSIDPTVDDPRPRVRVTCRRLDGLLDELGIVTCDLLKIDCEGAEPAILAGAGRRGLARIRALSLEYHSDIARDRLDAHLARQGFRVWHRPCPVWRDHGLLFATRPSAVP